MFRTAVLPALLALVLALTLATSADARKRRFYVELYAPPPAAYGRSVRAMDSRQPMQISRSSASIATVVTRLVRDCHDEAAHLQNWPFEVIAGIAAVDETQRNELDKLRTSAQAAAEQLVAECPPVSSPAATRLEALEQAVKAADAAFATIEPALQRFYASLDDEQKARILRDLTLDRRKPDSLRRTPERRRDWHGRLHAEAASPRRLAAPSWAGICQDFMAALRAWPTREIEQGIRLKETQRVALYELVTASLKAAEALADRCSPETPITPVRRMAVLRVSLDGIRDAAVSIKSSFARFYGTLDQEQQARFAQVR